MLQEDDMKHPRFKICCKLLHLQDNLLTEKKNSWLFLPFSYAMEDLT